MALTSVNVSMNCSAKFIRGLDPGTHSEHYSSPPHCKFSKIIELNYFHKVMTEIRPHFYPPDLQSKRLHLCSILHKHSDTHFFQLFLVLT